MAIDIVDVLQSALITWARSPSADTARAERSSELDADSMLQVLQLADALGRKFLLPIARELDLNQPEVVQGRVQQPASLQQALNALAEAGFFAPNASIEQGGIALPMRLSAACAAILSSFDAPVYGYCMLTQGAANLLRSFADISQQQRFLPALESGRHFGTMCLSEPHAGSSVGDIKTSARRLPDGRFALRGNKMWISGGEHELSENIVHMVLARIEGAPPGTKGLSLFIVPRFHIDAGGKTDRSQTNGVSLIALNHKMGYRATVNCALSFGIDSPCVGELLGPENSGMACMFQMMNEARVAVGIGAAAIGWRGYQIARDYAAERTQGRAIDQPDLRAAPVPINQHADVKRMLLRARAQSEAALALCLYGAQLLDAHDDQDAQALLSLLTPMIKSWPSSFALQANDLAIQVLGGAGYTEDWLVEKLYRDNRLNPIHEGTHGIQGLDLLMRKLLGDQGAALRLLIARAQASHALAVQCNSPLSALFESVCQTLQHLHTQLPDWSLRCRSDPAAVSAIASDLLDALGTVVASWLVADLSLKSEHAAHPLAQRWYDNARCLQHTLLPEARAKLCDLPLAASAWQGLSPAAL